MDIILKQRMIGAIVLISLGVIFIPMLLSGKGELSSPTLKSKIPPPPDYVIKKPPNVAMRTVTVPVPLESGAELPVAGLKTLGEIATSDAETVAKPVTQPDVPAGKADSPSPGKTTEINATPSKSSKELHNAPATTKKRASPEAAVKQTSNKERKTVAAKKTEKDQPKKKITPVRKVPKTASLVPPKPVEKPAPRTETLKPGMLASWVVQVGSFKQKSNAHKLRNTLRKKGYASFVELRTESGQTVYRVRVGPELKRHLAETLLKKLQTSEKLTGIVMSYPRR